jgi:hypothetical protein
MRFRIPRVLVTLLLLPIPLAFAEAPAQSAPASAAVEEMAKAATNLLNALDDEHRVMAAFDFTADERMNWHFIPKPRKGLPYKEMAPYQRALAQALLSSGLSSRGYTSAVTIMSLEQILLDMEQGKGPKRDPEMYYFSIFGKPDASGTWGWRVEGHHLSLNFTIAGGKAIAAGPVFFGDNPAEVRQGPRKGLRVLDKEEDLGRALIHLLTPEQQKIAILKIAAPKEMITGAERKAKMEPAGIAFADLSQPQKDLLQTLVKTYAQRLRPELAGQDLGEIEKAGWDKVQFAWAGGLEKGDPHYYRLQGPTFLVEYDNTQNDANHIHTVWRDLKNDFGEDILRRHYDEDHKEAAK